MEALRVIKENDGSVKTRVPVTCVPIEWYLNIAEMQQILPTICDDHVDRLIFLRRIGSLNQIDVNWCHYCTAFTIQSFLFCQE